MATELPTITITIPAQEVLRNVQQDANPTDVLRLKVDAMFDSDLYFDDRAPDDVVVEVNGFTIVMDARTASRSNGLIIEYIESEVGAGFKLVNPNKTAPIEGIRPADVRRLLQKREKVVLVDVRTAAERSLANVDGARALDAAGEAELEALPKKTKLIFMSHHSNRARLAAQRFIARGFTNVLYVVGGIDAWSTMDPRVPRYGRDAATQRSA